MLTPNSQIKNTKHPIIHHHYRYSRPITRTQISLTSIILILNNLLNTPWLELIPRWVVRWNAIISIMRNTLLHRLQRLCVVLLRIHLWIMRPDPLWHLRNRLLWIQLHLIPLRLLQQLRIRKPNLLRTRRSHEAEPDMCVYGLWNIVLAAELETCCEGNCVLDGLRGAVSGSGQEGVSCVANLDDAGFGGCPCWLRVSPEKVEVDNGVFGRACYEFLEHGGPLGTGHFFHVFEDFFFVNGVVPVFFFGSGCLFAVSEGATKELARKLTLWFMIQIMRSGRVRQSAYASGLRK
jgi:hypothetical protein